jgi:hypothetical protein
MKNKRLGLLSRSGLRAGTKGPPAQTLHRSHVESHLSRLVSEPEQKVGPFVSPPLSRSASRDKSLLRAGIIGMFSTSALHALFRLFLFLVFPRWCSSHFVFFSLSP